MKIAFLRAVLRALLSFASRIIRRRYIRFLFRTYVRVYVYICRSMCRDHSVRPHCTIACRNNQRPRIRGNNSFSFFDRSFRFSRQDPSLTRSLSFLNAKNPAIQIFVNFPPTAWSPRRSAVCEKFRKTNVATSGMSEKFPSLARNLHARCPREKFISVPCELIAPMYSRRALYVLRRAKNRATRVSSARNSRIRILEDTRICEIDRSSLITLDATCAFKSRDNYTTSSFPTFVVLDENQTTACSLG